MSYTVQSCFGKPDNNKNDDDDDAAAADDDDDYDDDDDSYQSVPLATSLSPCLVKIHSG